MEEVLARLNQVGFDIAANLETAAKAGAKVIRDAAKDNAPVRTGTLRDSITTETVEKDESEVIVRIGPNEAGFYGKFIECGTHKMAARPWFRPAVDEKRQIALKAAEDALRRIVSRLK